MLVIWLAVALRQGSINDVDGLLTIRMRNAASVMRDLQPAKNELVGAFFQSMQIKTMPNSVWQSRRLLPLCVLNCLQLDLRRACCGTARSRQTSPASCHMREKMSSELLVPSLLTWQSCLQAKHRFDVHLMGFAKDRLLKAGIFCWCDGASNGATCR